MVSPPCLYQPLSRHVLPVKLLASCFLELRALFGWQPFAPPTLPSSWVASLPACVSRSTGQAGGLPCTRRGVGTDRNESEQEKRKSHTKWRRNGAETRQNLHFHSASQFCRQVERSTSESRSLSPDFVNVAVQSTPARLRCCRLHHSALAWLRRRLFLFPCAFFVN